MNTNRAPNPWGITFAEAAALDAVCITGCNKLAAAMLSVSLKTIEQNVRSARDRMGERQRIIALLKWDRFRRAQGARVEAA